MERPTPPVSVPAKASPEFLLHSPPFPKSITGVCAGFSSEAELLSHLKSTYDLAVAGSQSGLQAAAQHLLSAVKTFFSAESDGLVSGACLGPRRDV